MSCSVAVLVEVTDVNDNPPVFTKTTYEAFVLENATLNQELVRVRAVSKDAGVNAHIHYAIAGPDSAFAIFDVDKNTG